MTTKTTIEWFQQLSEGAEGTEEKREAMATAFTLACQGATVPPSVAIAARKAMNRAFDNELTQDNESFCLLSGKMVQVIQRQGSREEYKAQHSAVRASGE